MLISQRPAVRPKGALVLTTIQRCDGHSRWNGGIPALKSNAVPVCRYLTFALDCLFIDAARIVALLAVAAGIFRGTKEP